MRSKDGHPETAATTEWLATAYGDTSRGAGAELVVGA